MLISNMKSRSIAGLGGLPVMQEEDAVVLLIVLIFFKVKWMYLSLEVHPCSN